MVKIDKTKDLVFDDSLVSKFYEKFLDENEDYKYELYLEKMYYLDINTRNQYLFNIDKNRLKQDTLNLIKSMVVSKNIESYWNIFKNNIENDKLRTLKEPKVFVYLFLMGFNELKIINNKNNYKNIDCYIDSLDDLISYIIEFSNNNFNVSNLTLLKSSNFKNSINNDLFSRKEQNYYVLMLELILINPELNNKINTIMEQKGDFMFKFKQSCKLLINKISSETIC